MTESQLMETLQKGLDKLANEEHKVSIVIYGGTEELQQQLAKSVFGNDRFQDFCNFVNAGENLSEIPAHVIWAFEDVPQVTAPCYQLNGFSLEQITALVKFTAENISGAPRNSFIKRQQVDIDLKEKRANAVIAQHCAGAFGVGFIPIPFSDAPILVTNEIALMSRIFDAYGLTELQNIMKTIGISTIVGNLLTMAGKGIVGGLLKFLPGIGTLVGGFINGVSATGVTFAFGKSVSKVVKQLCKSAIANRMQEVEYVSKNFAQMVTGTAVRCLEEGKMTAEDYKEFDEKDLSLEELVANIEKGNELFQKFLDKSAELDNEFNENQKNDEKLSADMWNAIDNI